MIQNTRNIKIKLFAKTLFAFAFALCLFKPLTADAKGAGDGDYSYTYEDVFYDEDGDSITFDSAKYAEQNPDVVAVIGNDPAVLFNHYLTAGRFEGRKGYTVFNRSDGYCQPGMSDSELRPLEFADTHFTDDMTEMQKFQILWDYLLDENNRADMNNGEYTILRTSLYGKGPNNDCKFILLDCLDAWGIEWDLVDMLDLECKQVLVSLDGTVYNFNIEWARRL